MSDAQTTLAAGAGFAPYLPRLVRRWAAETPQERWRELDGSLVSVDLSGFTALSERLAAKGRVGAEELILLISGTFEGLIGIAERRGGDVLKFRGDALLILFHGARHELRACKAASEMQWLIEHAGATRSSVGEVRLRMATGIYSGPCHFYVVGSTHRELVVTGPGTSETFRLESAAEAGEIVVSARTAEALDRAWLGADRDGAHLLALPEDVDVPADPAPADDSAAGGLAEYVPAPLREHLLVAAGEGEHRHVAVAFLKFSGTDALLEREGQAAVHAQLELLGQVVGDVAADLGITWLESDIDVGGGKLYLTAGAPTSIGDDEERMLRAVRQILDAEHASELRAGVNRGRVFAGDIGASTRRTYAVTGDAVNLAARLVARAGPGELYATADALDRSRTVFETHHQPYLMKGKERPVTAYAVGAITGTRSDSAPGVELPLVGREEELARLRAAVDAARMRQTQLLELVGEPGIGKSRLVGELLSLAVGFQQLVVRCERYERSHPYFALRGILRPLAGITPEQTPEAAGAQLAPWVQAVMPDLAPWLPLLAIPFDAEVPPTPETESLDPAFRRDRLNEVVDGFLTRVLLMPTLIVVEDAHWLDDASQFLLRHLGASPMPRPWLVCVTRRPEGAPVFADGAATRLELEPLPEDEVTRLALAAAAELPLGEADLAALTERSGGNPLFVRELVAAARDHGAVGDLPETVETLITARIDRLDPADRMLLRYASVIGPAFDLDTLDEILQREPVRGSDPDRWARLAEFVSWDGVDALRFRHDLFRAVAYAGLSFRRRREIHRRLAEALERRVADPLGEGAGLLSLHYAEAGEYAQAWRYAVAAGKRAQAMHANVVAAELYQRALGAAGQLPELPAAEVADVWESLGDVAELFGRYETAADAYAQARALVEDDGARQAALFRKEGVVREREGLYEDALELYDRGLALAQPLGDRGRAELVELELARAGVRFRQARFDDAVARAEVAAEHAERLGDTRSLAHAYYLLDLAHTRAGRRDNPYKGRALPLYAELDDPVGHAAALNNVGNDAYFDGRWDEARARYAESGELSRRAGDVVSVARAKNNEGEILSDQGRLEEAEERFSEALRVWRAAGYRLGAALATSNLGRAAARAGRFDEARRLLGDAAAQFEEIGSDAFVRETRARLAECSVLEGEHRHALAELDALAAMARPGAAAADPLDALLERLRGYALVQERRPAEARPHLERSLEVATALGADFERALALKALADTGAPDAERLAADSAALLDRLGVVATPRVPLP